MGGTGQYRRKKKEDEERNRSTRSKTSKSGKDTLKAKDFGFDETNKLKK